MTGWPLQTPETFGSDFSDCTSRYLEDGLLADSDAQTQTPADKHDSPRANANVSRIALRHSATYPIHPTEHCRVALTRIVEEEGSPWVITFEMYEMEERLREWRTMSMGHR